MRTFLTCVLLLVPSVAGAQICRGLADISSLTPLQGGGIFDFTEASTGLGGVVVGGGDGYFVEGAVGWEFVDDTDITFFQSSLFAGGQIDATDDRRVMICPGGIFSYGYSGDVLGAEVQLLGGGGGISFGAVVAETDRVKLIPTVGMLVRRVRARREVNDVAITNSDTVGTFEIGAGVALNDRFTIKPSILIPFLVDGVDPSFRLTFTIR